MPPVGAGDEVWSIDWLTALGPIGRWGRVLSRALAARLASPGFGKGLNLRGEPIGVEEVWVEGTTDPFSQLGMTFVFWILDGFEEFSIAPWAAAVFGRTAAARVDQARIDDAGYRVEEALDFDRVVPAITKVVEISHRLGADVFDHLVEASLAGIEEVAAGIGCAPSDIGGADLVKVAIGPAHCGLDRQMQTIEPNVEWHLDAAQNRGLDVIEGDLEAGDRMGAHAATLRRSLSLAQFRGKKLAAPVDGVIVDPCQRVGEPEPFSSHR